MRRAAFGAILLCFSCDLGPTATERWTARRADASAMATNTETSPSTRQALARLRERLDTELPRPEQTVGRRCPDESLAHGAASLPLRTRDVRQDRRQLLPLRLMQTFTSPSIAEARAALDAEAADSATDVLERLSYVAELQIAVYRAPKLFRRKDAPRSEWAPGVLTGDLVVYDAAEKRALCQAPISVIVSGDGEPIRSRTRDVVRERMTAELERRSRAELERALLELSRRFTLEPASGAPGMLAELEPRLSL